MKKKTIILLIAIILPCTLYAEDSNGEQILNIWKVEKVFNMGLNGRAPELDLQIYEYENFVELYMPWGAYIHGMKTPDGILIDTAQNLDPDSFWAGIEGKIFYHIMIEETILAMSPLYEYDFILVPVR